MPLDRKRPEEQDKREDLMANNALDRGGRKKRATGRSNIWPGIFGLLKDVPPEVSNQFCAENASQPGLWGSCNIKQRWAALISGLESLGCLEILLLQSVTNSQLSWELVVPGPHSGCQG